MIMHTRHRSENVPTEVVRALATIADTGSFTKAADKLGLSQPAISAQIKRLQILVGGTLFDDGAGGVTLSERGKIVLQQARRLLDANDQIVLMGGALQIPRPLRVGIGNAFAFWIVKALKAAASEDTIQIFCDSSVELSKGIADGYIDVACLMDAPHELIGKAIGWKEKLQWVRGRNFVLTPAARFRWCATMISAPSALYWRRWIEAVLITALPF